jgi:hypothetical protein
MKLTVKLSDDLGSKTSQTGQSFSATLDKDVIVDGQTAIPAGASVSGTIVSARPFGKYAGEASLTLKLTSVNINNIDQNIATAPRSFGRSHSGRSIDLHFHSEKAADNPVNAGEFAEMAGQCDND